MEVMNLWREKLCPSISHWFSSLKSINKGGLFSHSFLVSNCYFWVNKNIQRLVKWSLFPMSYHSTLLMLKPVWNLNFNSSIIVFITNKLHGALLLKLLESPLSTNTRNEQTMCRASLIATQENQDIRYYLCLSYLVMLTMLLLTGLFVNVGVQLPILYILPQVRFLSLFGT